MIIPYKAICEECGNEYMAKDIKNRRFCSRKCSTDNHRIGRKIYYRICPYCKKEFKTIHGNQKSCSRACAVRASIKRKTELRQCVSCGVVFSTHIDSTIKCLSCRRQANRKRYIRKNRTSKSGRKIGIQTWHDYICPNCGDAFKSKSKKRKFCSKECSNIGVFAPNFNPDRELVKAREKVAKIATRMVFRTIRYTHRNKKAKSKELLGYTGEDLRKHLEQLWEPGMSWNNHGKGGWHVDHIKPVSSFPVNAPLSEINALNNLQPLWEAENYKKGRKVF